MSGLFCEQDLISDIKETITGDESNCCSNNKSNSESSNSSINSGIKLFLGMLLDCLTPDLCRSFILSVLDKLDELVKQTDNKVDDFVVNAVTNKIRELLSEKSSTNTISSLSENQTKELNLEIDKLVKECDDNIQTGMFNALTTNNLFENISSNINSMKINPFEKQCNNPFENK